MGELQEHIDRRLRELRRHFLVPAVKPADGGLPRYQLQGWAAGAPTEDQISISSRVRAQVLAPQRCFQCGKTPQVDGVKLVVDHKVPLSWGGGNEKENLQPLCEECNSGKRDYFQTYEAFSDQIRMAINHPEPQKRIGEFMKALKGTWLRTDLLGMVASAREFQEDWQRRLRDLRYLGWVIEPQRRYNEGARVWTYYRLVHDEPWPDDIRAAIKAEEKRRRAAKQQGSANGTQ